MLPKELYLPSELNQDLIGEYFHIRTYSPQKGKLKKLLDLAKENAKEQLELQEETLKKDDKLEKKLLRS